MKKNWHIFTTIHRLNPPFTPDDGTVVSASLGFAWRGDGNDEGEIATMEFLEVLPYLKFGLYDVNLKNIIEKLKDPNILKPFKHELSLRTTNAADVPESSIFPGSIHRPDQVLEWLKKRGKGNNTFFAEPHYFQDREPRHNELKASHALRGQRLEIAPGPEWHGLRRRINGEGNPTNYEPWILLAFYQNEKPPQAIIIDVFDGSETIKEPNAVPEEIVLEIGYDFSDKYDGRIRCSTNLCGNFIKPASRLVNQETGFIHAVSDTQETWRILESFRKKAGALHWTLPRLIDPNVLALVGRNIAGERYQIETAAKDLFDLALAGLVGALDPIIMTLRMPGLNTEGQQAEGEILDEFIDILLELLEDLSQSKKPEEIEALASITDENILSALRDNLSELALCKPFGNTEDIKTLLSRVLDRNFESPKLGSKEEISIAVSERSVIDLIIAADHQVDTLLKIESVFRKNQTESKNVQYDTPFACITAALVSELNDLALLLETEKGAETAAFRLLTNPNEDKFITLLTGKIAGKIKNAPATSISPLVRNALMAFKDLLDGPFNGAEAVRQSVNQLFAHAAGNIKDAFEEPESLRDAIIENCFVAHVLGKDSSVNANGPFASLGAELWRNNGGQRLRSPFVTAIGISVHSDLEALLAADRFVPDLSPQPLAIQVARTSAPDKIDSFNDHYGGVIVAIRPKEGNWSVLNACTLAKTGAMVSQNEEPVREGPFLMPLKPMVNKGIATPFIGYEGRPFASRVFDQSLTGIDPALAVETTFTKLHEPEDSEHLKAPPLAYGVRYDLAQFAVSTDFAVPRDLQLDETLSPDPPFEKKRPWLLTNKLDEVLKNKQSYVRFVSFSRRTAIGRVSIEEMSEPGAGPRIKSIPPDVFPLMCDYPRIAVTENGFVDLFRASNGKGMIKYAKGGGFSIILTGVRCVGAVDSSCLCVSFFSDPRADGAHSMEGSIAGPLEVSLKPKVFHRISLSFRPSQKAEKFNVELFLDEKSLWTQSVAAPPDKPIWIRLHAVACTVALDKPTAPDTEMEERDTGEEAPFMLVSPENDCISKTLQGPVSLKVTHPRVTVEDFMRMSVMEKVDGLISVDRDLRKAIMGAQIVATDLTGAEADPRFDLPALVNKLPDLSVAGLLFELVHIDSLTGAALKTMLKFQPNAALPELNEKDWKQLKQSDSFAADILRRLRKIDTDFVSQLEISSSYSELEIKPKPLEDKTLKVNIPAGQVAELRIHPAVKIVLFEVTNRDAPVLDPQMLQIATGYFKNGTSDYVLFGGACLKIEAIDHTFEDKPLRDLVESSIAIAPEENNRSYCIVSPSLDKARELRPIELDDFNNWRRVGRIDVHAQSWSPSGKPIYSWIDPVALAKREMKSKSPVLDMSPFSQDVISFEDEAFIDRADDDETITTVRLDPLPGITRLKRFDANGLGAGWSRHRFTLRSRYEGAFKVSKRHYALVTSWDLDEKPNERTDVWAKRVAMLADLSQLEITRPQQRALIPLTRPPANYDNQMFNAPPILALMQEPPHPIGGLADQVVAALKTGFGYQFEAPGKPVSIKDARKEIGPDPRLTQSLFKPADPNAPEDPAIGIALRTEGPMGLTFEADNIPDPRLFNSAHVFTPIDYGPNPMSESQFCEVFAGIETLRYLRPGWLFDPRADNQVDFRSDCVWIDAFDGGAIILDWLEIVKLSKKDDLWLIAELHRSAADPNDPAINDPRPDCYITICKTEHRFNHLALLHKPMGVGHYLAAIFGVEDSRPNTGDDIGMESAEKAGDIGESSRQSLLLAVVPWQEKPRQDDIGEELPALEWCSVGQANIRRCMASQPTFTEWTRTARNFNVVTAVAVNRPSETKDFLAVDLVAYLDPMENALTIRNEGIKLWIRPKIQFSPHAQFVHRSLGAIVTRTDDTLGRPVQVFDQAVCADGAEIQLDKCIPAAKAERYYVHFVEFETPARPLGFKLPDALDLEFGAIDIDPHAAVQDLNDNSKTMVMISGRFLHSTTEIDRITLQLQRVSEKTVESTSILLPIDKRDLTGFELLWRPDIIHTTLIARDGSRFGSSITEVVAQPTAKQPGRLQIAGIADEAPGEFWCDVSVRIWREVTTSESVINPLQWLFSDDIMTAADPKAAIKPDFLDGRKEAQTRVVAISPPIPVING